MSFAFGEAGQGFDEAVAAVRADPDQSWREVAHLHYVELMLTRAGRESMRLARRLEIPEARPNTNEVKAVVDLLWDAMAVLAQGKISPSQAEHVEALYRLMKRAEKDGEASAPAAGKLTVEDDGTVRLSSGRTLGSMGHVIGIPVGGVLEACAGYDHGLEISETGTSDFTEQERHDIAEHMIERWRQFGAEVPKDD